MPIPLIQTGPGGDYRKALVPQRGRLVAVSTASTGPIGPSPARPRNHRGDSRRGLMSRICAFLGLFPDDHADASVLDADQSRLSIDRKTLRRSMIPATRKGLQAVQTTPSPTRGLDDVFGVDRIELSAEALDHMSRTTRPGSSAGPSHINTDGLGTTPPPSPRAEQQCPAPVAAESSN